VRESEILAAGIRQMLASGEPLSFYDAVMAVRRARKVGDLGDRALGALMAMHDAETATDGARAALAEFLGAYAERITAEKELGARVITVADNNKTARVASGATLTLHLAENAAAGFRWEVERASGAQVQRRGRVPGAKPTVAFEVTVTRAGRARVSLVETRPSSIEMAEGGVTKPGTFSLAIVVEP
jgi:predicted secreted protein